MTEGQPIHEEEPGGKSGVEIFVGRDPNGVMREFETQKEADAWENSFEHESGSKSFIVHRDGKRREFKNLKTAITWKELFEKRRELDILVVHDDGSIIKVFNFEEEAIEYKKSKGKGGESLTIRKRTPDERKPIVIVSEKDCIIKSFNTSEESGKWVLSSEGYKTLNAGNYKFTNTRERNFNKE